MIRGSRSWQSKFKRADQESQAEEKIVFQDRTGGPARSKIKYHGQSHSGTCITWILGVSSLPISSLTVLQATRKRKSQWTSRTSLGGLRRSHDQSTASSCLALRIWKILASRLSLRVLSISAVGCWPILATPNGQCYI